MSENGQLRTYQTYQTDHWQDKAVDLVGSCAARSDPFFMWVNFLAPHWGGPIEADDPRAVDETGIETPNVADEYRDAFAGRAAGQAFLPRGGHV